MGIKTVILFSSPRDRSDLLAFGFIVLADLFDRILQVFLADKREELTAALLAEDEKMGTNLLSMVAGQAVGNTIALGVGFGVHLLAG